MTAKKIDSEKTKKVTKREPTSAAILKKVATVSDSSKALQKEIKVMSKIFGDNQKVLVSIKDMIDTLTVTLEHIQKQSKQINILEDDTQKLYEGLNHVRSQSSLVTKINDQTVRLQEEVNKINELQKSSPKTKELSLQVEDSMNSMRNNSQMIIKIAQRIDEVREDLRKVSGKADSFLDIGKEIDHLKSSVENIIKKTDNIEISTQIISSLNQELGKIKDNVNSGSKLNSELEAIKVAIDAIAGKAIKIDALGGVIEGLKQQFATIAASADSALNLSKNSVKGIENIEEKISSVSDILKRQDASTIEFHRKSDKIFEEMQLIKSTTSKTSDESSKEMIALLKLSEYQSKIRMHAESKYGELKNLENMAEQTVEIVNLFDKLSIEADEKIPLPLEVIQWAISKILDCADKWEIRFSDIFAILLNNLGKDMLRETIRIQQIRDIYGIRAIDEIRSELNIS